MSYTPTTLISNTLDFETRYTNLISSTGEITISKLPKRENLQYPHISSIVMKCSLIKSVDIEALTQKPRSLHD